jgi:hypothetical protein
MIILHRRHVAAALSRDALAALAARRAAKYRRTPSADRRIPSGVLIPLPGAPPWFMQRRLPGKHDRRHG